MQKAVQLLGARKVKHEFSEVTRYDWAKECGVAGSKLTSCKKKSDVCGSRGNVAENCVRNWVARILAFSNASHFFPGCA
jgi:hypothetical protein